ncbi:MAG: hypothetical protein JXJ19_06615 [Elusimicrobia bacterium]|nr:hypothetical protein [Elusimicrobiota bacterium]
MADILKFIVRHTAFTGCLIIMTYLSCRYDSAYYISRQLEDMDAQMDEKSAIVLNFIKYYFAGSAPDKKVLTNLRNAEFTPGLKDNYIYQRMKGDIDLQIRDFMRNISNAEVGYVLINRYNQQNPGLLSLIKAEIDSGRFKTLYQEGACLFVKINRG